MKTVQIGFSGYPKIEILIDAHLWSCNGLHTLLPDSPVAYGVIHSWFQIHREVDLYKEAPEHLEWLKIKHPFPIYMVRKFKEYPSSVPLPVEDLKKLWTFDTPVSFASSFSWMVALAILQEYDEIEVRGVHFTTPREAYLEAPNFMAWLGIAAGQGIKIRGYGRLFDPYLYGQEERVAPTWLPQDVAQDLILDQVDEGRKLRSDWLRRRYARES